MIEERQQLRIGAICALAFSLLSILGPIYLNSLLHGDTYPDSTKLSTDAFLKLLLPFVHRHQDLWVQQTIVSGVSYLVLLGVVWAAFVYLRGAQPALARVTLAVGALAMILAVVAQVLDTHRLLDYAQRFAEAGASDQTRVVHDFKSAGAVQIIGLIGSNALAIWLAIVGIALLRIQGNRSTAGWVTIAVGLLSAINLPLLFFWCIGAAAYLWRATVLPPRQSAMIVEDVPPAPPAEYTSAPTERRPASTARRERQRALANRTAARRKRR